jgi:hypothetical protein
MHRRKLQDAIHLEERLFGGIGCAHRTLGPDTVFINGTYLARQKLERDAIAFKTPLSTTVAFLIELLPRERRLLGGCDYHSHIEC